MTEGFVAVPHSVWESWCSADLSGGAFRVLMALSREIHGWNRTAGRVPLSKLVSMTGLRKRTVQRALTDIEAAGLLRVTSPGNRNGTATEYRLTATKRGDHLVTPPQRGDRIDTSRGDHLVTSRGDQIDANVVTKRSPFIDKEQTEQHQRAWTVDRLYHQITGKGGQAIPPILAEQLLAIVDAFTDDQIERAAGPSASARSPVKYFISLFNVDAGTTKVDSPKTNGDRGDWLKSHGGTIHSRARSDEGFTRFADIDHPGWLTLLGRISDIPAAAHPALAEALVEKHSR